MIRPVGCRLFRIDRHRPISPEQAKLGMQYLLEILADQTVDVGLVAVGGGGEPTDAAIVIRAPTEEPADDGAMSFELAAGSVAPWLGLVPADDAQLERLLGERPATTGYEFAVRGSRRQIIAAQTSPFWTALARSPGGWRVTATVGEPHGRGLCGLSITGTGAEGPLLATLLAVDAAPNFQLEPRLARGVELDRLVDLQRLASAPPTLPLDLRELAWLFSFPVRAQGRSLAPRPISDRPRDRARHRLTASNPLTSGSRAPAGWARRPCSSS